MHNSTCARLALHLLILLLLTFPFGADAGNTTAENMRTASLDECIQTALDTNHRRPASRFAVQMAEAQHRQALAGYWPQLSAKAGYQHLDEPPNFLFPARTFTTAPQQLTVNTPLGPLPINVPEQHIDVPEQNVKLMEPDSLTASASAQWLLYDGGMRKGYREQGENLVTMMREEARRTDLEIVDGVTRLYYGAVLARQLYETGRDALARMDATLTLTETMYKEGGGRVKKTDWLDNKVMVESLRAMNALLEKNELMAQAALANTMGLPWNASVRPADAEIPFTSFRERLDSLVATAYAFNPDWNKVEAGLRAAQGAERTARSGHYPKVALTGELHTWVNGYDAGLATPQNRDGWSVGVGMEIPIFDGFLTTGRVQEARARIAKIREEQILLKEGLGLQIRDTFLALNAAEKAYDASREAMDAAVENRDLNTRAYQQELVDTEKVIRAQFMESLMTAQHCKARFDHAALQSQLRLVVGSAILRQVEGQ